MHTQCFFPSIFSGVRVGELTLDTRAQLNRDVRVGDLLCLPGVFRVGQVEDEEGDARRVRAHVWANNLLHLDWNVKPGTRIASPRGGSPDR